MRVDAARISRFFSLNSARDMMARALPTQGGVDNALRRLQGILKLMKLTLLFLICVLTFGAAGCSSNSSDSVNASLPKSEKDVEKEDGSTVSVSTAPNGTKTEARTFPSGDVARVTRITSPNGRRRALVEFRDTRVIEMRDGNEVDRVIEASADTVRAAAVNALEATKSAGSEVADKTEDVADKAADTGKDAGEAVGDGAKRGAEEVGDAASDAAGAAKKGARKAGKGIKKVGEKVKDSVTP